MIRIAWSPIYCLPLPTGHRFPMEKYSKVPEKLIAEGWFGKEDFFDPGLAPLDWITSVHHADYVERLENGTLTDLEAKRIGFPYSKEMVSREKTICAGTTKAALYALKNKIAFNVAGGTHHAGKKHGEGYCIFNDIAVASNYLLSQKIIAKILIIDLDVHHGNGTAEIFSDVENVYTFSIHGAKIYPLKKPKSDFDIAIESKISDSEYIDLLENNIPQIIAAIKPEIIFYQAGVDILHSDKLGNFNISIDGCMKRDIFIFSLCKKMNIPITVTAGGGYSDNIQDIIDSHCNTYKAAREIFQ